MIFNGNFEEGKNFVRGALLDNFFEIKKFFSGGGHKKIEYGNLITVKP